MEIEQWVEVARQQARNHHHTYKVAVDLHITLWEIRAWLSEAHSWAAQLQGYPTGHVWDTLASSWETLKEHAETLKIDCPTLAEVSALNDRRGTDG